MQRIEDEFECIRGSSKPVRSHSHFSDDLARCRFILLLILEFCFLLVLLETSIPLADEPPHFGEFSGPFRDTHLFSLCPFSFSRGSRDR